MYFGNATTRFTAAISVVLIGGNLLLEYLEMLNGYNCERWACSMVPLGSGVLLGLICLVLICAGHNYWVMIGLPADGVLLFNGLTMLRWDIDPIGPSDGFDHDRHRAEYYNTHLFALVNYMLVLIYILHVVYRMEKTGVRPYQRV